MLFLVSPDHSNYQDALTKDFNRRMDIMRCTQGTYYLDQKFLVNAAMVAELYRRGIIIGAMLYHVFTGEDPVAQFKAIWKAIGPNIPDWLLGILHDFETWPNTPYQLKGDHSSAGNKLMGLNAAKMGSWNSVPWYGNQYDIAELIPHRDVRTWGLVAAYTSELVYHNVKGAKGQQYTDGELKYPVPSINGHQLPRSTVGLGNCDHNVIPGMNALQLRAFMRPSHVVKRPHKPIPKPHTGHPGYKPRANTLVTPDEKSAVFFRNDQRLELRRLGKHVAWIYEK